MLLVTGASGLNGSALVRRLSAQGVPVRALVRSLNPAKIADLATLAGVEIVAGDMARPETLVAALHGVERAFLTSSSDSAMLEVQSSFINAASAAGVRHVVKLSGIMPELDSAFRFARMHAHFRQVPSIVSRSEIRWPMEDARIASVDVADIADVAVAVLTGAGHAGQ